MDLISRYKRLRSEAYLKETYTGPYAFVGLGGHSLANLYPVLHYLQIPLKYICVTSAVKAKLIEKKFPGIQAVTDLGIVLADPEVKGVFVAASPKAHFSIAKRVLESGKALFVEKPPCADSAELEQLITLNKGIAVAGLQKRYAPSVKMLKAKLAKEKLLSYDLHYCTGAYPEGNAVLDLYIHPVDLVCHLFGPAEILACSPAGKDSYVLMLKHKDVTGTLELSTAYSWKDACEVLKVNTGMGLYTLNQMEELTVDLRAGVLAGIPLEKTGLGKTVHRVLYAHNPFSPVLTENQVYIQGYFDEIRSFALRVERTVADGLGSAGHSSVPRGAEALSDLASLRPTYQLLDALR